MASRGRVFCKKSNYVVYKKIIGITDTCYLINVCKLFSNNEEIVCQSVSQISTSAEEIWNEPRSRRDFMFKCSQNTLERLSWSSGGRATHAKVFFNKILNPKMNLCMCVNNTLMPVLMLAVKSTLSFQLKVLYKHQFVHWPPDVASQNRAEPLTQSPLISSPQPHL